MAKPLAFVTPPMPHVRDDAVFDRLGYLLDIVVALTLFVRVRFHVQVVTFGSILAVTLMLPYTVRAAQKVLNTGIGKALAAVAAVCEMVFIAFGPRDVSANGQIYALVIPWLLVCTFAIVGLCERLGPRKAMVLVGVGGVVGGIWAPNVVGSTNDWKYNVGFSASLAILAMGSKSAKSLTIACGLILVLSIDNDTRSLALLVGAAFVLNVWHRQRIGAGARRVVVRVALGLAAVYLGLLGALHGWLGGQVQSASLAQSGGGGPWQLLLGARPELTANVSMVANNVIHSPFGNVLPGDLRAAYLTSFAQHGGSITSAYVQNYLLADPPQFHSIAADAWYYYGIPGLVLAGVMLFVYLRTLVGSMPMGRMSVLAWYLAAAEAFYLLAGPTSDLRYAPAALGLYFVYRTRSTAAPEGHYD